MGPGPSVISDIRALGKPVFVDAKLHDIPNTVLGAARQLGEAGARWVTVHASGGRAMIEAAVEGLTARASEPAGILAVTVLTSIDTATLTLCWSRRRDRPSGCSPSGSGRSRRGRRCGVLAIGNTRRESGGSTPDNRCAGRATGRERLTGPSSHRNARSRHRGGRLVSRDRTCDHGSGRPSGGRGEDRCIDRGPGPRRSVESPHRRTGGTHGTTADIR